MNRESLVDDGWLETVDLLGGERWIAESARKTKAFVRPRKIRSATDLLRLTLAYCLGRAGMRATAAWAGVIGLAHLSDVALLGRLRNTGDWLTQLVGRFFELGDAQIAKDRLIRILDATSVAKAGVHEKKNNGLWRVHCSLNLEQERFDFIELTDEHESELIDRVPVVPGEIRMGDRAYLQADRIGPVLEHGGDVLVRAGWNNARWLDQNGAAFDLIARLKRSKANKLDFPVWLGRKRGKPLEMRMVALRKSEAAANETRRKLKQEAQAKGRRIKEETLIAAGFVFVVTSLSREEFSTENILKLYRMRWRIELAFKRLKSLIGLRGPPAKDPRVAKPWILAHLLIALMAGPLIEEFGVSPS